MGKEVTRVAPRKETAEKGKLMGVNRRQAQDRYVTRRGLHVYPVQVSEIRDAGLAAEAAAPLRLTPPNSI